MKKDRDLVAQWTESAPYWEKNRKTIALMFSPITQALLEAARITRGQSVLDVATGPGEPALSMVDSVGSDGHVVGIDMVPSMVEAARREAERRKLHNVRFDVASAGGLPFSDDTFEAVVSRFGVMFFPSPLNGIREMLRVLKPDKTVAMAVWHSAGRNPFHNTLSQIVSRYIESPPPAPDAPDTFRFAAPGKLLDIIIQAGAVHSHERLLQFRIEAPMSVAEFWSLRCEMSDKVRAKLRLLSQQQISEIKQEFIEAIQPYFSNHQMSIPAEVLIVSGDKKA